MHVDKGKTQTLKERAKPNPWETANHSPQKGRTLIHEKVIYTPKRLKSKIKNVPEFKQRRNKGNTYVLRMGTGENLFWNISVLDHNCSIKAHCGGGGGGGFWRG